MMKGEVHSKPKPRGMMPPEGHSGARHGAAPDDGGYSSSDCSSVSSGSSLEGETLSDLSDLSDSDAGRSGSS
ncbi:unnamed protein product [Ectocarpus fasciculatus]